jgi:hypothetical protein
MLAPPQQSSIACVAIIGAQNQPLLLHVGGGSDADAAATPAPSDDPQQAKRLRLSYVAHCALDALEEKVLLSRRAAAAAASASGGAGGGAGGGGGGGGGGAFLPAAAAAPPDAYLGLLYPTEEFRVYGYCSATHLKVVLVVEQAPLAAGAQAQQQQQQQQQQQHQQHAPFPPPPWPRDAALAALCRRLHAVYVDAASNPFFVPGAPLGDDPRVLRGVDAALAEFEAAGGGGGGGAAAAVAAAG